MKDSLTAKQFANELECSPSQFSLATTTLLILCHLTHLSLCTITEQVRIWLPHLLSKSYRPLTEYRITTKSMCSGICSEMNKYWDQGAGLAGSSDLTGTHTHTNTPIELHDAPHTNFFFCFFFVSRFISALTEAKEEGGVCNLE